MDKQNNIGSLISCGLDSSIVGWPYEYDTVVCPICGFEFAHIGDIRKEEGNDNGDAGWSGRGDLVVIPIEGECGCLWEICFGFHKGCIAAFVRVIQECEPEDELDSSA